MKAQGYFNTAAAVGIAYSLALNLTEESRHPAPPPVVASAPAVQPVPQDPLQFKQQMIGDHLQTIMEDQNTGVPLVESWSKAGKLDRDDGPALIKRDELGRVEKRIWMRDGHEMIPI